MAIFTTSKKILRDKQGGRCNQKNCTIYLETNYGYEFEKNNVHNHLTDYAKYRRAIVSVNLNERALETKKTARDIVVNTIFAKKAKHH